MFCFFGQKPCGILAPWSEIELATPARPGSKVLTTEQLGKSPNIVYIYIYPDLIYNENLIVNKSKCHKQKNIYTFDRTQSSKSIDQFQNHYLILIHFLLWRKDRPKPREVRPAFCIKAAYRKSRLERYWLSRMCQVIR